MQTRLTTLLFSLVLLPALAQAAAEEAPSDPGHYWLDPTYDEKALAWVSKENTRTLDALSGKRLAHLEQEARDILTAPSRLPDMRIVGDRVIDYRQERDRPLGYLRATSRASYFEGKPDWRTLLDFDDLSAAEGKKWIFNSISCRQDRCLLSMSDNGKDAHEVREFDLASSAFIADGFRIPESKSRSWWYSDDTLLIAPVLGEDSVNESGFPKTLRLWKRGTPLSAAETLFSGGNSDANLGAAFVRAGDRGGFVAVRSVTFFSREYYWVTDQGAVRQLPLPAAIDLQGVHDGNLLMRLNEAWQSDGASFPAGDLVSLSLDALLDKGELENLATVYRPAEDEAVRDLAVMGGRLYLNLLRDYRSALVELSTGQDGWNTRDLELPGDGFLSFLGSYEDDLHVRFESLLSPPRVYLYNPESGAEQTLHAREPAFDSSGMVAERFTTPSRDGTEITYTVMRHADQEESGPAPTLVYGYGGFDVAITPRYEPLFGKLWLEKGGVYVHAYLRGGGERGPDWHRSAMLENRQRPYDDMIAVLTDIHARGISSPQKTGIMGRSNGGLMVSAVMTQRPDLMNAVVVGGPLTDMLHYQNLPPGASWTAEYGDPRKPEAAAWIRRYSPLQALVREASYPVPLVITSTDDDRVAPGHARRLVARMRELGHDSLYFEDAQGGHYWELAGGPAPGDWRLRAKARAVEFEYLASRLGLSGPEAESSAYSTWPDIRTVHRAMRSGELSSAVLTERHIARIDEWNDRLNAVIALDPTAREQARKLDERARRGDWAGPLHGIPVLIKDNIETADQATTAGSLALAENYSGRDAPLVSGLREAGAVILGKANLSEWANFRSERSASGWSAVGGQTRNPYDMQRSACGSSSGSGAAVAAGMAMLAVGTETNGSIVCPSSANGIVGIKPSVGLVSRTHIVPISNSQDTAGPMARSVFDAVTLLAAMAGQDPGDEATGARPSWRSEDLVRHVRSDGLRGKRIGLLRSSMGFHGEVDALTLAAVQQMRDAGATIVDDLEWKGYEGYSEDAYAVLLYEFKDGLNAYLAGLPDEALASLTLEKLIGFNRGQSDDEMPWFGQEIFEAAQDKGSLETEEYVSALRRIQEASGEQGIDALLRDNALDALIAPTGSPAWVIDLINGDHFIGGSSSLAAIAGYPSITVPMGRVHWLPVGLSIFGTRYSEPMLIEIASGFEAMSGGFVPPDMSAQAPPR
jgi:prolyl oligopeptidase PreP (S9A serine peptidase family)/Asp-tRNA(Asn)/Glu-tRNA(Gln) amidotransferase A subunit family amidase